jgi:hypothetical protein
MPRTEKHLGNVPTEASFPAIGSFPSPQLWNIPIDFFEPSIGQFYRRICQKYDPHRPAIVAGASGAGGPAAPTRRGGPADPTGPQNTRATHPTPRAWDKSHSTRWFTGGACVRTRSAGHITPTPDSPRLGRFLFAPTPRQAPSTHRPVITWVP